MPVSTPGPTFESPPVGVRRGSGHCQIQTLICESEVEPRCILIILLRGGPASLTQHMWQVPCIHVVHADGNNVIQIADLIEGNRARAASTERRNQLLVKGLIHKGKAGTPPGSTPSTMSSQVRHERLHEISRRLTHRPPRASETDSLEGTQLWRTGGTLPGDGVRGGLWGLNHQR